MLCLVLISDFCLEDLINILMLIAEIVGIVLVLVTLSKNKKTKQAEFIMEYNSRFISSDSLVEMERKLENCYQVYKRNMKNVDVSLLDVATETYEKNWTAMVKMIGFGPVTNSSEPVSKEYQKLVNYLVYLESFAPLVLTKQVQLKDIDDTFGYRYFIAMNNPVVQKYELLEEAEYYRGCIQMYDMWLQYRVGKKRPIPMAWYTLSNIGENTNEVNPVYQFAGGSALKDTYKKIAGNQARRKKRTKEA